ncbi:MAG: tetratricopeptide repeat protein [Pseudomonadales bacterium]
MIAGRLVVILASGCIAACAWNPSGDNLGQLRHQQIEITEVVIEGGLDKAMQSYQRFLDETPRTATTPEAMRRLADLKVEKEFGILGDGGIREMAAPETLPLPASRSAVAVPSAADDDVEAQRHIADVSESDAEFERRATERDLVGYSAANLEHADDAALAGPLAAIELYQRLLSEYPSYERNDQVLYQMARAYEELGRVDEAMAVMERLITELPYSRYVDEVQFRRAEYFFIRRKFRDAEQAYGAIVSMGAVSAYYELALYKLGWTLYKQEFYDDALHQYMALLDYKVSIGYDFDQAHAEADERRVADTYRVISLSFSSLGGPEVVDEYFATYGDRSYGDRIYSHLGEFYLDKRRYQDAAATYKAFVAMHPFHRVAPHFSMRVVEIYELGGFPMLVVESKKDFATDYGLRADYWRRFDAAESPEVIGFLKGNLKDLANHYHALYQDEHAAEDKPESYREALLWYREFLTSFPEDAESPPINYQLADLLLEHQEYGTAAIEYERTAYEYPLHAQSSAAGYAAVYAHREHLKQVGDAQRDIVKQDTVTSSLRFADNFTDHEHAPVVLGAAADDLYAMQQFERARAAAALLIERYPDTDSGIRRAAWTVVAHASLDLGAYPQAESAYAQVLELLPAEDDTRQGLIDNLAAAIYKQGEEANLADDHRAAADHFLRIRAAAPTSQIRPAAEYDAAAALMRLEDWAAAAEVLDLFRQTYPDHELQRDATRQIAFVYREDGQLAQAAAEYERIAVESDDPELRREAQLLAGELYEQAQSPAAALAAYQRYVVDFPEPIETAVETRSKIAGMHKDMHDQQAYQQELERIVQIDASAGPARSDRTRFLAAQAALVLTEPLYQRFVEVRLTQPFERSLQQKQQRMQQAMDAFGLLVDYEVGEVTAAATYYMAEIFHGFSTALMQSERPAGLDAAQREEYELVIEEEAFPFEENAIDVHEKNLELLAAGVYNRWIEKSLDRLADLMPGRYAKHESSSGFLASIDTYAYQLPGAADDPLLEGGESEEMQRPEAVTPFESEVSIDG